MRDMSGFIISRKKILDSRSTLRASLVTFAVANYLGEYYDVAFDMVAKYNVSSRDRGEAYEESEFFSVPK